MSEPIPALGSGANQTTSAVDGGKSFSVKDHPIIVVLATAVGAFVAGFSAYPTIMKVGGMEMVSQNTLEKLKATSEVVSLKGFQELSKKERWKQAKIRFDLIKDDLGEAYEREDSVVPYTELTLLKLIEIKQLNLAEIQEDTDEAIAEAIKQKYAKVSYFNYPAALKTLGRMIDSYN